MIRILIANGVNLDLLGRRETEHYGRLTLEDLEKEIASKVDALRAALQIDFEIEFFQTNDEREYLEKVSRSYDGLILNPGAWTHTSLALADRLRAVQTPFVEVHLSNIAAREGRESLLSPIASCVIFGAQAISYEAALVAILRLLDRDILKRNRTQGENHGKGARRKRS